MKKLLGGVGGNEKIAGVTESAVLGGEGAAVARGYERVACPVVRGGR